MQHDMVPPLNVQLTDAGGASAEPAFGGASGWAIPGAASVRITGFAKGAAMIGPNMATMLAFVMTDAAVGSEDLANLAPLAAERSSNSISA